jgi:hypothetical protein
MFSAKFLGDRRPGLELQSGSRERAGLSRRRANRRIEVGAEVMRLEERQMLSGGGVPVPTANPVVDLSTIFWNGGPPLNTETGIPDVPAPYQADAVKTITIRNNSTTAMIYPFLTGENIGQDPLSTTQPFYDPQDIMGHEFRLYIGYSEDRGGKKFFGLPKGASITIQVPLALWDGDDLFIATDGTDLTKPNIFFFQPSADLSFAGTAPVSGTSWVTASTKFPTGDSPMVAFYYDSGPPLGVPTAAPAQLTEVTFRDQYLKYFINDPSQTQPLLSYDVSYVNNLVAPVSMEASDVPITFGNSLGTTPPTYYGYQNWGWAATDRDTVSFGKAVEEFVHNTGDAAIGKYFGGKGWPEYYNPNPANIDIPSGGNLFLDSPFNVKAPAPYVHTSPYNSNYWLLTSSGDAPITAGGGGYGQQGYVRADMLNRIYFSKFTPQFGTDLDAMLKAGVVNVSYPGQATLATVKDFVAKPTTGMPYVTLNSDIEPSGDAGKVYAFSRTASDYAITDITNLWYSWAGYHVAQYANTAPPDPIGATLQYFQPLNGPINMNEPLNEITLSGTPTAPLAMGMTVSAPTGIPAGTTILKVVGNNIFLSQIPASNTPLTQTYTFGNPVALAYDPKYTTPYTLTFSPADTPFAQQFGASVYEAMAAEQGLNPSPYLPDAMSTVGNVIQFYAKLPGYTNPDTGPLLVAQVRDVVKSILRGVPDYLNPVYSDQSLWYPNPVTKTGGQDFNVINLDPYVWFVHAIEKMSAYGFSVDDDVANPIATGPLLAPGNNVPNHSPSNLQVGFGGTNDFANPDQWFPTIPWGKIDTTATISDYTYQGVQTSLITLSGSDAMKLYNQINNPGTGQIGAFITGAGITRGTTVIFKGPNGADKPQFVLSQPATATTTAIPVSITGTLPTLAQQRAIRRG